MAGPLGSAPGIVVGVGVGTAAAAAIEPAVELPRQKAWAASAVRVLDPAVMARLVAQGGVSLDTAHADGLLEGYANDKLNALVYLAQTVPGFADAMTLWRRGDITDAQFTHALVKAGLEPQYMPDPPSAGGGLYDLKSEWLSPAQVALAIVRGLLHDPGLMAVTLDAGAGNVTKYTESTIDALAEALGGGVDRERLRVMVGSIGLPMSTQAAAQATFRKIITRQDFNRSILEGDVRPEWADAIFDQSRQYPTAHDHVEDHLRGWTGKQQMYDGTATHGMSQADTDILFRINGRPLSFHQVFIGIRRGGKLLDPTVDHTPASTGIHPDFFKSLQQSNIRPEWYDYAWSQRFTYPAAFVLRSLTQSHDIDQPTAEQILLYEGWEPGLAKTVSTKWYGGAATTAAQKKQTLSHLTQEYLSGALSAPALTNILTTTLSYSAQEAADEIALAEFNQAKAARTRAIRALEKRFVAVQLSDADARTALGQLGLPAGAIEQNIIAWVEERLDTLTTLTVARVQKAYKKGVLSAAVATTLLQELGEDAQAIQTILASA